MAKHLTDHTEVKLLNRKLQSDIFTGPKAILEYWQTNLIYPHARVSNIYFKWRNLLWHTHTAETKRHIDACTLCVHFWLFRFCRRGSGFTHAVSIHTASSPHGGLCAGPLGQVFHPNHDPLGHRQHFVLTNKQHTDRIISGCLDCKRFKGF